MDEKDFVARADACLGMVAREVEKLDPDELDYSTADGSVTLEFPDGSRFILSRQSATRQVWLAAAAHAYHFDYDASKDRWVDDKDGHELFSRLAELVSDQVGHAVKFAG
jgi:iron-sulfur cluster assembly protein CyaY